jgi:hypothetical protein
LYWHKRAYEERLSSEVKRKLKIKLAGLDGELCAGQIPSDFKARIDAAYQDVMSKCDYI